jgi:hypothetical protein
VSQSELTHLEIQKAGRELLARLGDTVLLGDPFPYVELAALGKLATRAAESDQPLYLVPDVSLREALAAKTELTTLKAALRDLFARLDRGLRAFEQLRTVRELVE